MEKKVVKPVKRYGNSGGVYLPSSWIGGKVSVELVDEPPVPERDIPMAFAGNMRHVIGAFIYGSYARNEQHADSDVDVLIVTDEHMKSEKPPAQLKARNYDVQIMPKSRAIKAAKRDILFKEMLKEAKPILNEELLHELVNQKTSGRNIGFRVDFARSSLRIMKSFLDLDEENSGYETAYPLVMRIKEMLLLKCFLEGRKYSLGLLNDVMLKHGIPKSDIPFIISQYRAFRDGRNPENKVLKRNNALILASILEEVIKDVEKQKAKKGY
ncbi:MAG: nucleotidyltransferase domain-containing protein [Candidatus Aenigmarchaeota archaeon]|nr:nucleotidyltransferase domain-containing protein [Candidatus Aenigmarchaeota archaeon]